MTDTLYDQQIALEEEARGLTIKRFVRIHEKATENDGFAETPLGSHMITNYIVPFATGIQDWCDTANAGKAGRKHAAVEQLQQLDTATTAFLFLKTLINFTGYYKRDCAATYTQIAIGGAGLIHDELRLRHFNKEFAAQSKKIHKDFAARELPRHKREEYMRKTFKKNGLEWAVWSKTDMLRIGSVLISIFSQVTGDLIVTTRGTGKAKKKVIEMSHELRGAIMKTSDNCEALMSVYLPMVVPPRKWESDTLNLGGYLSLQVSPYALVKHSKPEYRTLLRERAKNGELDRVLNPINKLQETSWSINEPVLDAVEFVYDNNIACGKMPKADMTVPDAPPPILDGWTKVGVYETAENHPIRKHWTDYQIYRFKIHESNRRVIGKRVMAKRAFQLAHKFSKYDALFFPHDLDSRGRAYPKPVGLNPQGPDYVKGLLQFAEAKPLGTSGLYWLGVHGANCWGEDKVPLLQRANWSNSRIDLAHSIAANPRANLEWTKADSPAQFLAFCLEWSAAHHLYDPTRFASKIHVDLDATCSGLQHFSAMLRDAEGGFHVNMLPSDSRQDVYEAVANKVRELMEKDLDTDNGGLAAAWLKFGIDRAITKRPVMVKPYSGTRTSCSKYVSEAVDSRLDAGEPIPWPKETLWDFKYYGATKVWEAIPTVVIAAAVAMKWLSTMARLVGKSQPNIKRVEWNTPLGLPVWQSKFNMKSRTINTYFDGKRMQPRLATETDRLDSRQMGSSVAPSFVHSLDATHLMATIDAAARQHDITAFAAIHDSFGVHACEVEKFTQVIREQFVAIYEDNDVLQQFHDMALPLIDCDKFEKEIPDMPVAGNLDLQGILNNQFFFS